LKKIKNFIDHIDSHFQFQNELQSSDIESNRRFKILNCLFTGNTRKFNPESLEIFDNNFSLELSLLISMIKTNLIKLDSSTMDFIDSLIELHPETKYSVNFVGKIFDLPEKPYQVNFNQIQINNRYLDNIILSDIFNNLIQQFLSNPLNSFSSHEITKDKFVIIR